LLGIIEATIDAMNSPAATKTIRKIIFCRFTESPDVNFAQGCALRSRSYRVNAALTILADLPLTMIDFES